eukprot:724195_1
MHITCLKRNRDTAARNRLHHRHYLDEVRSNVRALKQENAAISEEMPGLMLNAQHELRFLQQQTETLMQQLDSVVAENERLKQMYAVHLEELNSPNSEEISETPPP